MTLNFQTQQGFNSSLPDLTTQIGTQSAASKTAAVKKASYKTDHAENSTSRDQDKFAEIMQKLKKRQDETQKTKETQTSEPKAKETDAQKTELFLTQQAQLITEDSQILVLNTPKDSETPLTLDLSQLDDFGGDLKALIEEQTGLEMQDFRILTSEGSENSEDNFFAVLVTFKVDDIADASNSEGTNQISAKGFLDLLQQMIGQMDEPMIESDMTPEEITVLQEIIQKAFEGEELTEEDMAMLEELTGPVLIIAPIITQENKAKIIESTQKQADAPLEKVVMPQTSDAPEITLDKKHFAQTRYEGRYDAAADSDARIAPDSDNADDADFKALLKDTDVKTQTNAQNTQSAGEKFLTQNATGAAAQSPLITTPADTQAALIVQPSHSAAQSAATSVITQSQSAGQAHPATQLVSATIQKAAKGGENTDIKLQLDPPELGRVEVKMSIDKDNATKMVLTAEKPETYMMLQKDSDLLMRALENAGLDAQSGDLSFELASEDHDFNNPREQNHSGGGKGRNQSADETIIETTMDMHIDPETGTMRYNILA